MRKIMLIMAALVFLTALLGAAALNQDKADRPAYASDMIKVKLSSNAISRAALPQGLYAETTTFGINELDQLMSVNGGQKVIRAHIRANDTAWEARTGFDRWFLIKIDGKVTVEQAIKSFKANRYIEDAIPEYYAYTTVTPNDTYYANNWGHNNTAQLPVYSGSSHSGAGVGTIGFDSDAQLAWDQSQGYGSASTIIAIIDTGVDLTHPDLRLVAGYDYGDNDSDPSDNSASPNHGTACSGVAAGIANNGLGVTGSGGGCSVMPLKIADSAGSLGFTAIENALMHCGNNNVDVASMSFGAEGGMAEGSSPSTDTALEYAYSHGVTLLAATANSNTSAMAYPSNHNKVISVGAASPTGQRKSTTSSDGENWWGSNYGGTTQDAALSVDIMAPTILPATDRLGTNGYSTTDYYLWFNGTSCATPYAAGCAGVLISKDPSLTPAQVRTALTSTATDMTFDGGAGWDRYTGYGMVNLNAALNSLIPGMPACTITAPTGGTTFDINSTISVAATATDTDGTITQVAFYIDANATPSFTDYSSPYTWSWNTTGVSGGAHTIKAIATDNSSNTATSTVTITLLAPPDEGFETGGFGAFAWNNTSASPWTVQSTDKFSGTYAARSGAIADGGSTTLSLPMTVSSAGNISFYQQISSESGYDYLTFYIDGVQQAQWSGTGSWSAQSYAVTAGSRTFTWTYSKDGSVASGSDCAWIDHIIFPPHGTYYAPPQNFSATPGNAVVNLAWQAPASGSPTGYKIFKNSALLTTVTGLSYSDTAVVNETTYSYYLKAVYGANESDPTATINAMPTAIVLTSIIIGTGTASNGTTEGCPINVYYQSLHGQSVYTKAEINALGVYGPINITQIGFNVTGLPTLAMPSFIVRMNHTTSTNVASWIPATGMTTVYSATSYQPTVTGYNMLTLSTPFTWNGNDNIVVDTAYGLIGSYTSSGTTQYTTVTSGYRYVRSDTVNETSIFTGGSTSTYRPNLKLTLAPNAVGPKIVVNPTSIPFGSVNVGSSSVQQFTIQNTGDQTLTGNITTPTGYTVALAAGRNSDVIASTLVADNSQRDVLSYSINAGATKTYNLTFSPTAVQSYNGNVSISSNDPANPTKTITLTGTGAGALITVNPTTLAFGNVAVNGNSTLQFTIQNTGNITLTGSVVTPTGYTVALVRDGGILLNALNGERNTLGISVNAGQTLTYNLTFAPTAVQAYNGNVTITTNAFNSATSTISVTGTGTGALITVNPVSRAFGSVTVNTSSTLQFTVQNTGNTTLTGTITTPSGYSVAAGRDGERNTLAISVNAGQTLTYNLTFAPTAVQAYNGNVVISTNAIGMPTVNVAVTGSGMGPWINVAPTSLTYGNQVVNTTAVQQFTVQNTGNLTLTGTIVTPSGYSVSSTREGETGWQSNSSERNTIGITVTAGQTLTYYLTFAPTAIATYNGNVVLTTNAVNGSPVNIAVTGAGTGAMITVNPSALNYGNVVVNTTSVQQFTVQNTGNELLSGTITTPTGYSVAVAREGDRNTLNFVVSPGQTKTYSLTFAPTAVMAYNGSVEISTNAINTPTTSISLTGSGYIPPTISLNYSTLDATLAINATGDDTFTISNSGSQNLTYTLTESPAVGWFSAAPGSGTVTGSGNQLITGSFTAVGLTPGVYTTTLQVASNDTTNPLLNVAVTLNVTNALPTIVLPASLSYDMNGSLVEDFDPYVNDVDGQTLTLGYSGNTNVLVSITGLTVTFTATPGWYGTEDITFSVYDGYAYAYDSVPVTVNFVNSAPTIDLPVSLTYDMNGSLVEDFDPYVNDVDGQTLTLGYSGNTNVLVSITGLTVTFTATPGWYGTEDITFSVYDGYAYAYDAVPVTVNFVNTPPTIDIPANLSFDMNGSLVVDFAPYVNDIDGQTLILGYSGNTNVLVDIVGTTVTFTAVADWFGEENLTFSVYDGYTYTNDGTTVTVIMNYLPPPPVETIIETGTGTTVGWIPVANATEYKIYRSFDPYGTYEYIGTTTDPTFEDWGVNDKAFYKVVAVYTPGTK